MVLSLFTEGTWPIVLLAARALWWRDILEIKEALRLRRARGQRFRFRLLWAGRCSAVIHRCWRGVSPGRLSWPSTRRRVALATDHVVA